MTYVPRDRSRRLRRFMRFDEPATRLDLFPRTAPKFFRSMRPQSDCWLYTGALNHKGYGHVSIDGVTGRAHILVYQEYFGSYGAGLVLDHLCHTRHCYNPLHLEPITNQENVIRGNEWRGRYETPVP